MIHYPSTQDNPVRLSESEKNPERPRFDPLIIFLVFDVTVWC